MTIGYGSQRLGIRFSPIGKGLIHIISAGLQVSNVLIGVYFHYPYDSSAYQDIRQGKPEPGAAKFCQGCWYSLV